MDNGSQEGGPKLTRRTLLRGTAGAVGVSAIGWLASKMGGEPTNSASEAAKDAAGSTIGAAKEALKEPLTESQIKAGQKFDNPDVKKIRFEVIESPDYNAVNSEGPAYRNEPRATDRGVPLSGRGTLKPGMKIEGVFWEGHDPDKAGFKHAQDWVAFKLPNGDLMFTATKYLKDISDQPQQ